MAMDNLRVGPLVQRDSLTVGFNSQAVDCHRLRRAENASGTNFGISADRNQMLKRKKKSYDRADVTFALASPLLLQKPLLEFINHFYRPSERTKSRWLKDGIDPIRTARTMSSSSSLPCA
jgi:hypothetical protein